MKLSTKIWVTIIIIILLSSVFYYWTALFLYNNLYVQQEGEHLEILGKSIADIYQGGEISREIKAAMEEINKVSVQQVLIADDPSVLGQCLPIHKESNSPFTNEQLEQLHSGEIVTLIKEDAKCERDLIIKAIPFIDHNDNDKFVGAVFTYIPLATVSEAVSDFKFLLIIYVLVFILIGTIVGKIITLRITKNLRQMETVAIKMVDGDFDTKVEISSSKDEVSQLGQTLNHLSDSLKETIGMLSKEKNQLSQILDGISDSVITVYLNEDFVLCNGPAIGLLRKIGFKKEDFFKQPIIDELISKVTKDRKVIINEINIEELNYLLYLAPLIEENNLWGIIIVIHDVTDERKRENEVREFLAVVSHELRTPLSYVKGYTEALMDGVAESKEKQDHYLKTIHNETGRMERLVNDLLDLAQLEKGIYPMNKEEILLENVINEVIERYQTAYESKGVNLSYINKSEQPLRIIGDEDRLIQVMVNLLDNALRHTPKEGSVFVETFIYDDKIILQIKDTGEGIEESQLSKLGERFYRVDKARSRKSGGTGLGLAIVKQIIERLKGRFEINSKKGAGTTIRIYFPYNFDKSNLECNP